MRYRSRSIRQRDNQRSRVYGWERAHIEKHFTEPLQREGLQVFTNTALGLYSIGPVKIRTHAGRGRCAAFSYEIRYANGMWHKADLGCVLHESSHVIVRQTYPSAAGHGKEFMGVYINLLHAFGVADKQYLKATARAMRVKISSVVPEPRMDRLPAILRG